MAIEFSKTFGGWFISEDEVKEKCSGCFQVLNINDCFRCETTNRLICRNCNQKISFVLCGQTSRNPEHSHHHIIGTIKEDQE